MHLQFIKESLLDAGSAGPRYLPAQRNAHDSRTLLSSETIIQKWNAEQLAFFKRDLCSFCFSLFQLSARYGFGSRPGRSVSEGVIWTIPVELSGGGQHDPFEVWKE